MKAHIAFVVFYFLFMTKIDAGTETIEHSINDAINQVSDQVQDNEDNNSEETTPSPGRKFSAGLLITGVNVLLEIEHYGCWCYFGSEYTKGRGKTQDEIDEMCQMLHFGYECIIRDSDSDGTLGCFPWDVNYTNTINASVVTDPFTGHITGSIESDCSSNIDLCALRSCVVEMQFVHTYFHLWIDRKFDRTTFAPPNKNLLHSEGFDSEDICHGAKSGYIEPEQLCCGDYPFRFPYNSNGNRACCGNKTYNPNIHQCCLSPGTSFLDVSC